MEFTRTKALYKLSCFAAKLHLGMWKKIFRGEVASFLDILKVFLLTVMSIPLYPICLIVAIIQDSYTLLFASEERKTYICLRVDALMESLRGL